MVTVVRSADPVCPSREDGGQLSRTRPWEALGMSRATWYRKGKPVPEGRETTFGIQQVLAAPCCIPSAVSPSAARKRGCPKEDHPSQAISHPQHPSSGGKGRVPGHALVPGPHPSSSKGRLVVAEAVRAMSRITKPVVECVRCGHRASPLARAAGLAGKVLVCSRCGQRQRRLHCFFGYLSQCQSTGHCRRRRCG